MRRPRLIHEPNHGQRRHRQAHALGSTLHKLAETGPAMEDDVAFHDRFEMPLRRLIPVVESYSSSSTSALSRTYPPVLSKSDPGILT